MKKILFLLLCTVSMYGQVSSGMEQEFDYGIKNNSTQTVTTPTYLGTVGADGTYGKILLADLQGKKAFLSTGLIKNGTISINADPTKFNITAGIGIISNFDDPENPISTIINFPAFTGITPTYLLTGTITYVAINDVATVVMQATPFTPEQRRSLIVLGAVIHSNLTTINVINHISAPTNASTNQLHDFIEAVGALNLTGNKYTANGANLQLNKSAGLIFKLGSNFANDWKNPHELAQTAGTSLTFRYRTQNGTEGSDRINLDPALYDLNNVLTAVPNNKFTIQTVTMFQSGGTRIQYGQNVYDDLATAKNAVFTRNFVLEPNSKENGIIRAYIIMKNSTTSLQNVSDADILEAQKFGGIASGGIALTFANIVSALGYTPANDVDVIHKTGDESKNGFFKLTGFTTPPSGKGLELFFNQTDNVSGINSYDRTNNIDLPINIRASRFQFQNGFLGINNIQSGGFANIPITPLHVGDRPLSNSSDAQILLSRNVNNSISGNGHGFSDSSDFQRNVSGPAYNSFDARIDITGTGNRDHYAGFQNITNYSNSGTMSKIYGHTYGVNVTAGKIIDSYGFYSANPILYSSSGLDNNYGLYVEPLSGAGISNYSIYTAGSTPSYFGGSITTGGALTASAITTGGALTAALFKLPYGASGSSRSWIFQNNYLAEGDLNIVQSTTQTGSSYASKLYFSPIGDATFTGAATFSSSVTATSFNGSATLTGTPTAPTAAAGTNTTQIATTAFVQGVARPYKVYTALLTQSGTDAPTAIVVENTLGGTVVWSRKSAGLYEGTLSDAFTANKTTILNSVTSGIILTANPTTSTIQLETRTVGNVNNDSLLIGTTLEIRVYN